jgi:hypothetical protein
LFFNRCCRHITRITKIFPTEPNMLTEVKAYPTKEDDLCIIRRCSCFFPNVACIRDENKQQKTKICWYSAGDDKTVRKWGKQFGASHIHVVCLKHISNLSSCYVGTTKSPWLYTTAVKSLYSVMLVAIAMSYTVL